MKIYLYTRYCFLHIFNYLHGILFFFFFFFFFWKTQVIHGSLGANIGLLENDRIISIDGRRCKTLEDVHLSLLNKSRCVITVKRTVIVEVSVFQKKFCCFWLSLP